MTIRIRAISDAGVGNTTWDFLGAATASYDNSPVLDFDGDSDINNGDGGCSHWNLADFSIGLNDTQVAPISTTPTLMIDFTEFRGVDGACLDTDGGFDDIGIGIGIGVTGTTNSSFVSGDAVAWNGSMLVSSDMNSLILGTYNSSEYGGEAGALDL